MKEIRSRSQWPSLAVWSIFIRRGMLLTLLWIVIYGGSNYLTAQHSYRVRLHFDWELGIPFWPHFAIVYLSLFPMLWLSPFVLRRERALNQFANALTWLFIISGIGFLLLPSSPAYHALHDIRQSGHLVIAFADRLNLDFNMLPSLHVGMAILCAAFYGQEVPLAKRLIYWSWACAIVFSVFVTHQHHAADVIAAALVAGGICFYYLRGEKELSTADGGREN